MATYRIKANPRRKNGSSPELREGDRFTTDRSLTEVDMVGDFFVNRFESHERPDGSKPYGWVLPEFIELVPESLPEWERELLDGMAQAKDVKDVRIEELEKQLRVARDATRDAKRNHEREITLIGEHLIEVADSKGYCDDYDEMIDDLNAKLGEFELPTRERSYDVALTFTQRICVTARDEESAIEAARESYDYGRCDSDDEDTYQAEATECDG